MKEHGEGTKHSEQSSPPIKPTVKRRSSAQPRQRAEYSFTKADRLLRKVEFDAVFAARRSRSDAHLVVYALPNGQSLSRLGLVVGRRVGNAVVRNRWKRLIREAFRLRGHEFPKGVDLVVLPRGEKPPQFDALAKSLAYLANAAAGKAPSRGRR